MNDLNKYTLKGKTTILETKEGKVVIKEKNNVNIKGLFNYLTSRGFDFFPKIIEADRKDVNVFEHLENIDMPIEQKGDDLINIISLLHNKTNYSKEVSEDKFKEIYENISSNINYYKEYYDNLFNEFIREKYTSPSKYKYLRNYYKINAAFNFAESELDNWYEIVKKENNQRISVVHNNLKLEHFFKNEKDAIISWDNYKMDTPVLDLVKFYQNEYFDLNFDTLFKKYNERFPLLDHEKKLFFILISIPPKITFDNSEFENTINLRKKLDYLFKSEKLIKPYYSEYNTEE